MRLVDGGGAAGRARRIPGLGGQEMVAAVEHGSGVGRWSQTKQRGLGPQAGPLGGAAATDQDGFTVKRDVYHREPLYPHYSFYFIFNFSALFNEFISFL